MPQYLIYIVFALTGLNIVTFILLFQLKSRIKIALIGKEGEDLEQLFKERFNDLKRLQFKHENFEKRIKELETIGKRSFQRSALVRYNALNSLGGNQSFSLALLDNQSNGFVLSVLSVQEKSRLYFKPVKNGKSAQTLSDEEREAVKQATVS